MQSRMSGPHWRAGLMAAAAATYAALLAMGSSTAFGETPAALPAVPAEIQVPPGNTLALVRHAVGTQDYVCLPSASDFKFVLVTPRATLFADEPQQVATHYFSPNPSEDGTIRATWQDSRDESTVWGQAIQSSSDADFVAPGAIAWVLLRAVGAQDGSGEQLTAVTYIQRVNTAGGVAPSTGCSSTTDVGNEAFVPYTADYLFYESDA